MTTTDRPPSPAGSSSKELQTRTLAKAMTRSAFLHIQDALSIGKLSFWLGRYRQGSGCESHGRAYLDLDAARVILGDILLRGNLPPNLYPEQKIEFYGGSEREGQITARVLRFRMDPSKRSPVVVEVATGPGKRNQMGGFQPLGEMETVGIYLDVMTARRLAGETLAQIQAWETCNEAERRRQEKHTSR